MSGFPSPSPIRSNNGDRDKDSMWYFNSEDLANSPSRRNGISPDQELSYRQMAAYLIQEMGQRLRVSQLCINTAIVYMHRFYAFHSFTHFHRNGIASASLFLAAKVEEQPRKLEHVIKAANKCLTQPTAATTDSYYIEQAQDLVFNENVLLQTLGFDVAIDHPHTHVVKTCQLVKACKELAHTSYFLASNSLHLTSMCLQYKPTVVACFCIYLACKWSRWEIPQSTEGKHWFHYVDETVTMDLLKKLTEEFIAIYEKSPARLKAKLNSIKAIAIGSSNRQGQSKDKKGDQEWKVADMMKMYQPADNPSLSGGSSQSLYGGPIPNEQMQGQIVTTSMLPPPPHQPASQIRKSELHSAASQHRSHHSSSSSSSSVSASSHHASKIGYTSGDVPDHKITNLHKQQPPYGNNLVNRSREHSSSSNHSQAMMVPSSKSSATSACRSSLTNNISGQPMARQTSQSHSIDIGYHKSRDRNLPLPPAAHNVPPHVLPHKMPQKQSDTARSLVKDHSVRITPEQQAKQSSNSSKIFSSSSSSNQFGTNQSMNSVVGGLPSNKLDGLHDMSRSMMHSSRGYNQPITSMPSQQQQPSNVPSTSLLNFHQQQQGNRHSNSSSNIKHEQSKQISVHMQQSTHSSTHHHKQLQQPDTNYLGLLVSNDLQQQQQQQQQLHQQHSHAGSLLGNSYCKIEPLQHSDEQSMPQFTASQTHNASTKTGSMFSPDWSQEPQQIQPAKAHQLAPGLNYNNNGNLSQNYNSETYSAYKLPVGKETSPKIKTERETPSKKDKNRSGSQQQDSSYNNTGRNLSLIPNQPTLKTSLSNKLDQFTGINELAGTSNVVGSTFNCGGIKRPNDLQVIKSEDESVVRDSKIRKLDNGGDASKHNCVVNGIETNPDLVRNLLKESLCQTNALIKTENSIITPSLHPPAELFEPSASTSVQNSSQTTSATTLSTENVISGNPDVSAMETDEHGTSASGSKSEKKKKKDKHKHKEKDKDKDKSKDREERKKHKKDKDRHKDKDRETENTEHVKIKISKEKLEAVGEPIGFKIKIPKDRILGDISTQPTSSHSTADATANQPPPALKIKILKDKLESYSSGTAINSVGGVTNQSYNHSSQSSQYAPYGSTHPLSAATHTTSSGSTSSKKKDRDREKDREREKDKKRSHDASSKSNGGSGGHVNIPASNTLVGATINGSMVGIHNTNSSAAGSTTQKSQYSSKVQ